jgi:hypothetical protein
MSINRLSSREKQKFTAKPPEETRFLLTSAVKPETGFLLVKSRSFPLNRQNKPGFFGQKPGFFKKPGFF